MTVGLTRTIFMHAASTLAAQKKVTLPSVSFAHSAHVCCARNDVESGGDQFLSVVVANNSLILAGECEKLMSYS